VKSDDGVRIKVTDLVITSDAPKVRVSPLFEALLHAASGLMKGNNPSAAVFVAQTAIEVCTERLINGLLKARDTEFLGEWIDSRLPSYNIVNKTVRKLYEAVSEDTDLKQQAFWNRLQDHVELRNDIAHEGRFATPDEGKASVTVAGEVIRYLTGIAKQRDVDLDRGSR
jgi:hypothetical protein